MVACAISVVYVVRLFFLVPSVGEKIEVHIHIPFPRNHVFNISQHIYGVELTKNSSGRSSSCPHGRGLCEKISKTFDYHLIFYLCLRVLELKYMTKCRHSVEEILNHSKLCIRLESLPISSSAVVNDPVGSSPTYTLLIHLPTNSYGSTFSCENVIAAKYSMSGYFISTVMSSLILNTFLCPLENVP
ncbi:MAG: hypothetical protein CM15mV22_0240 [Eurybiavirus sp.]|nr:MAG: hypothetical protein CM15mV22_0240 [Eurybiavirus sp.]